LLAVAQQAGAEQPAQHAQQNLNSHAQQAQQGTSSQVTSLGGVLRKPRPVGIGHMCRAISTLTGGKQQIVGSTPHNSSVNTKPKLTSLLVSGITVKQHFVGWLAAEPTYYTTGF